MGTTTPSLGEKEPEKCGVDEVKPEAGGLTSGPGSGQNARDSIKAGLRWRAVGTVLLVDDEPTLISTTTKMLESFGLTVTSAKDGVEAVERFRVRRGEIACVLMDLTMPRMGGLEAFGRIRAIDPHVPVILSSGYAEKEVLDGLSGRGPSGFLKKPYGLAQLRDALREVWDG